MIEQPSNGLYSPKTPALASPEARWLLVSLGIKRRFYPPSTAYKGYFDFAKVLEVNSHARFSPRIDRLRSFGRGVSHAYSSIRSPREGGSWLGGKSAMHLNILVRESNQTHHLRTNSPSPPLSHASPSIHDPRNTASSQTHTQNVFPAPPLRSAPAMVRQMGCMSG